jgi:hypothetical protein
MLERKRDVVEEIWKETALSSVSRYYPGVFTGRVDMKPFSDQLVSVPKFEPNTSQTRVQIVTPSQLFWLLIDSDIWKKSTFTIFGFDKS